jgi:hypothetical protein
MTQDEIETLARQLTKVEPTPDNIEAVIGHLSVDEGGVLTREESSMNSFEERLPTMTRKEFLDYHRCFEQCDVAACERVLDAVVERLRELQFDGPDDVLVGRAACMISSWEWFSDNSVDERGHETCRDWLDPKLVALFDEALHAKYGVPIP